MKLTNHELKKIIQEGGVIDEEVLEKSFKEAEEKKIHLGEILIERNLITDEQIGQLVASSVDVPFTDLKSKNIDEKILQLIPKVVAESQEAIAFDQDDLTIKIATTDPYNVKFFHILQKKTGKDVSPYYITENDFKLALSRYKKGLFEDFEKLIEKNVKEAEKKESSESPIVEIVNLLLSYGYNNQSSDIHIEPKEEEVVVRFRIDGILHDVVSMPKTMEERLVTRIKVLAKLRTDKHSSAQDGKFKYTTPTEKIDIRVSILPVVWGEKAVLRLLSSKSKSFTLEEIGLIGKDLEKVQATMKKSTGMILSTGPTGCGKTTTLYSILKILNRREVNISTIEDPIEYSLEGVNQIQVNPKTNLTFAKGLRSLLRQDPDILMVGEIRDNDTAKIAVNAAMTGHLVLSTLHTNDSVTTLPRLLDMGVQPYLIASTVNIVIAQRLVRKICTKCVRSIKLLKEERDLYGDVLNKYIDKSSDDVVVYKGKGCDNCGNSGYVGRIGIFEVLEVDEDIQKLIVKKASREEIKKVALDKGMVPMFEDGIKKVLKGVTTLEEVVRVSETEGNELNGVGKKNLPENGAKE